MKSLRAGASALAAAFAALCSCRQRRSALGLVLLIALAVGADGGVAARNCAVPGTARCDDRVAMVARVECVAAADLLLLDCRQVHGTTARPRLRARWLDLRRGGLPAPRAPDCCDVSLRS